MNEKSSLSSRACNFQSYRSTMKRVSTCTLSSSPKWHWEIFSDKQMLSEVCALQIFVFHLQVKHGTLRNWALRGYVLSLVLDAKECHK